MNIEQSINDIEDVFTMTIYLVLSINYFILFLTRRTDREEKFTLFFSLFSVSCFFFRINKFIYI